MQRSLIPGLHLSIRAALAAGASVAIAQLLQMQHPVYALITAVLVIDPSPAQTRQLALHRLAGTLLGAGIGATLSLFMRGNPLTIGIGILFTMLVCHLLRLQDAARVAGFICGVILLDYSQAPWTYAGHRLLETGLGIAMAVLVSFVPKLIPADE